MSPRVCLTIIIGLLLVHVLFLIGLFWAMSRAQVVNFTLPPKKTSFHEGVSPASGHDTSRLVMHSSEDCAALRGFISLTPVGANLSAGCRVVPALGGHHLALIKQYGGYMTPTLPADSSFSDIPPKQNEEAIGVRTANVRLQFLNPAMIVSAGQNLRT